ncbi:hypothetical protein NL676_036603 [Syzygium grande]|nr:hypothetical protein NL676_036603 [Syzygium grande]
MFTFVSANHFVSSANEAEARPNVRLIVFLFAVHLAVLLAAAALAVRLTSHGKYLKIRVISSNYGNTW